jgi:SUKH-3 immunity protein
MIRRFNESVTRILTQAGWHPGRNVARDVEAWEHRLVRNGQFVFFDAAKIALSEFGLISIDQCGPGIDRAREPFILDPTRAIDAESVFEQYSCLLKKRLFPLGEYGEQAYLAIADTGEVYLLFEGALLVGATIESALANLIEGREAPEAIWMSD